MTALLKQLEKERGALIRRRDLAMNRKRGFSDRLTKLEKELKDSGQRLRTSKRAALTGGPGRLEATKESALLSRLTELPVEQAALTDVITETQTRIDAIDADILVNRIAIVTARQDEVEAQLLRCRIQDLELLTQRDAVRDQMGVLLRHWEAGERDRKALGDTDGRVHPQDIPDRYARDPQGHERSRDETRAALAARIDELTARLNGTEGDGSTAHAASERGIEQHEESIVR